MSVTTTLVEKSSSFSFSVPGWTLTTTAVPRGRWIETLTTPLERWIGTTPLGSGRKHCMFAAPLSTWIPRTSSPPISRTVFQVGEPVAALERLGHFEQEAVGVRLCGHGRAQRRSDRQHALPRGAAPARPADALEDRFRQQLQQLAAVAHMPVERGGLDLQPVCEGAHRKPFQALLVDQFQGGIDEPLPGQAALPLFFRAHLH